MGSLYEFQWGGFVRCALMGMKVISNQVIGDRFARGRCALPSFLKLHNGLNAERPLNNHRTIVINKKGS
jgi:hypothetical protein